MDYFERNVESIRFGKRKKKRRRKNEGKGKDLWVQTFPRDDAHSGAHAATSGMKYVFHRAAKFTTSNVAQRVSQCELASDVKLSFFVLLFSALSLEGGVGKRHLFLVLCVCGLWVAAHRKRYLCPRP